MVRFGDIADIKVGLQTGDNDYYLYQNPDARGNYKDINQFKQFLLTEADLDKIRTNEVIRLKVIEKGIHQQKDEKAFDKDCWFGGRYIVPYDKGGESDTDTGWLPNYYVPTNYYIDWSRKSVKRIKTLTTKQRNKSYGKSGGDDKICSVIRNKDKYFLNGISFSDSGVYAPTFRINFGSVFDQKGSCIFSKYDVRFLIGTISSKLIKYSLKNFINSSISAHVDSEKEIVISMKSTAKISAIVDKLIQQQKLNPRYDYQSNEQKQIDALVYEAYGLNQADINEVETWFARRYPKLAKYADIVPLEEKLEQIETEIAAESLYAQRVRELIELGENKRTEFKSTLRYCLKQNSPQPYIEHSVLKTIAAFLNSDGGTLLVGVADDGTILGLENDYATFGKNRNYQDEWVKHFDNIIGHAFSNAINGNIDLNFASIEEKMVSIIDIKRSATHVFMKNKADGNKKQFYIRRNGSTVDLDAEETLEYVKHKWG